MDKQILINSSKSERVQILRDSADKKETFTYPKTLGAEEVTQLKDEYTKNAISFAKKEEAKKDFMDAWKGEVKPLKLEMTNQMSKIRNRVEEVTEDVYFISDQDAGEMGYYNADGVLVYQRPLFPEERQIRLVDSKKAINQ